MKLYLNHNRLEVIALSGGGLNISRMVALHRSHLPLNMATLVSSIG